ncbi:MULTISPECIES: ComEA family DNA-binding protein [unclassified Streptomyces]|uniref:ComEA family DNA-binding protein n=1 Tax=unclassified Streptomyces TaxID=2593676 RepID=UPI0027D78378|nr:ComEA family DNA-binding protein [Streptomyces sp. DSM 40167]
MALRSRSRSQSRPRPQSPARSQPRTAAGSSGPGRAPASDGRLRHRHPPRSHARHGRRPAPAEELRRRAEALFAERAGRAGHDGSRGESGKGPPLYGGGGDAPLPVAADGVVRAAWKERAGQALRERMPVWLQARCGLERRSVAALTVLLVVAGLFAAQHFWTGRTQSVAAPEVVREAAAVGARDEDGRKGEGKAVDGAAPTAGAEIVVDVGGKVRKPGVHRLPAGSRVADALRAAGGVRDGAKTDGLNQARFLVDGEQVVVGAPAPVAGVAPGGAATAGSGAAAPAAPVSLNTATPDQLDTLPGVGPVLAQHIIDYRTQHGGFRSVDELREVNGIGERRFADLRDLVRP